MKEELIDITPYGGLTKECFMMLNHKSIVEQKVFIVIKVPQRSSSTEVITKSVPVTLACQNVTENLYQLPTIWDEVKLNWFGINMTFKTDETVPKNHIKVVYN